MASIKESCIKQIQPMPTLFHVSKGQAEYGIFFPQMEKGYTYIMANIYIQTVRHFIT
jgi:hypothetical protein